jgi:hypothetical protein
MNQVIHHENQGREPQGTIPVTASMPDSDAAAENSKKWIWQQTPPEVAVFNIEVTPKNILRLLYNTNPFYLISSMLVLYAQATLFKTGDLTLNTVIPVGIIAGYVVLLTATAAFIVRVGKVWNDARSIMMCILALLMILSVSMDSQTLDSLGDGIMWLGAGLAFSLLILETLRRQLKIRLPGNFLGGIYLLFGLFFIHPLIVSQLILQFPDDRAPGLFGILAFPVLAALAILVWIPSAMRGREVANNNGTPWTAPRFPWVVAGFLIICVLFRTYLLTLSFQDARGSGGFGDLETGFGPYMLIPPLLASMILLVEYGKAARSKTAIGGAILGSLFLILLGGISNNHSGSLAYGQFSRLIFTNIFNPLSLGFGAATVFYIYGCLRKIPHFEVGVNILVMAAMFMTMPFVSIIWIPAAVAVLIIGAVMIWRPSVVNQVFFIMTLLLGGTCCLPPMMYKSYALIHLCVLSIMLIGYFNRETAWGKFCRVAGTVLWLCVFLAAMIVLPLKEIALEWKFIYLSLMGLSGIAYCLLCRGKYFNILAFMFAGVSLLGLGAYCYARFMSGNRSGQVVFWAGLSFVGAVLISLHKGGILRFPRNRKPDPDEKTEQ